MERLVAYCGLVCSDCPGYIATQADDLAAKEKVLADWRVEYNHPTMTIADVTCDGCTTKGGRLGGHPPVCGIRLCGIDRGVSHCGGCSDYPCSKLDGLFAAAPRAKAVLDELRGQS
ncbi:MAG: DUF3795 domain-containing protein [Anaerolineae bacterium]